MPEPASDHVLRTLAAVPPSARLLDLGCEAGRHTLPLVQLGFDVWACDPEPEALNATQVLVSPLLGEDEARRRITRARFGALGYPDDHFDWVVACTLDRIDGAETLVDALHEARRVLKPGGWIFASFRHEAVGEHLTPETLAKLFGEAGFALSEHPAYDAVPEPVVRGIFRKVTPETVG